MARALLCGGQRHAVVASNPAAHRLFNLATGRLESQRLTELTRETRQSTVRFTMRSKETERSGVEIETHDPTRRVFDLRWCRWATRM